MPVRGLFFLFALIGSVLGGCASPKETKDRISAEALERLVADPLAIVRQSGLASGEAKFAQLLATNEARYGKDSMQVADLLMAFGVGLHKQRHPEDAEFGLDEDGFPKADPAITKASVHYLRLAIPRYRAAFGPMHPEVALALHTFADGDLLMRNQRLSPEARSALIEALRIRRFALGPENIETLATEDKLTALGVEAR